MLVNRIVGIVSAGFGAFLLLFAIPAYVTNSGTLFLNPALFPIIAAWMLVGLGLLQAVMAGLDPALPSRTEVMRFVLIVALTVAAALGLERFGYLATSFALMTAVIYMIHERRLLWAVITIAMVPTGIWLFFDVLLERPLP
ncbi:MAG: tripartite tricarboxylate transporter TctB family protein [Rhodobacteraceae bacterium]|nr:tripartite tricarboxylate transporter TctB family protein [Paracoccaceae bacterium]